MLQVGLAQAEGSQARSAALLFLAAFTAETLLPAQQQRQRSHVDSDRQASGEQRLAHHDENADTMVATTLEHGEQSTVDSMQCARTASAEQFWDFLPTLLKVRQPGCHFAACISS